MRNLILFTLLLITSCKQSTEKRIARAVESQLRDYPASTLQDLYKNFFQDYYGPGHLLSDTAASLRYLRHELAGIGEGVPPQKRPVEETGYRHQFLRVDLQWVKNGTLPAALFEEAFLESGKTFEIPDIEDWKKEWAIILDVIRKTAPGLPGLTELPARIDSMLNSGEYVMHHSDAYEKAYQPHYRLIHRKVFKEKLKPLLKNSDNQ
jgi:hypothetical protein